MEKRESFFQKLRTTKGWKGVIKVLRIVEALDVLAVVLLVFANTVSRRIFNVSFLWVEEVLTICALWMYFIGAVLGAEEESHIKGDLISSSIKNLKVRKWFLVVISFITAGSCMFFIYWALVYCGLQTQLNMTTQYLHLPKITSQYAVGFGMVGMGFYWVYHFLRYLTIKPSELQEPEPDEKGDTEGGEGA